MEHSSLRLISPIVRKSKCNYPVLISTPCLSFLLKPMEAFLYQWPFDRTGKELSQLWRTAGKTSLLVSGNKIRRCDWTSPSGKKWQTTWHSKTLNAWDHLRYEILWQILSLSMLILRFCWAISIFYWLSSSSKRLRCKVRPITGRKEFYFALVNYGGLATASLGNISFVC